MLENEIEREDKWLEYKIDLYLRISDFDDDTSLFGIDLIIELTFDFDEQGYFDNKKKLLDSISNRVNDILIKMSDFWFMIKAKVFQFGKDGHIYMSIEFYS
jgi:hypothetical protein